MHGRFWSFSNGTVTTLAHVSLQKLWRIGLRIGAATSLNIEDYDPDRQFLEFVHRPSKGTLMKIRENGERLEVSDRTVAGWEVLERHYGRRSPKEKLEQHG